MGTPYGTVQMMRPDGAPPDGSQDIPMGYRTPFPLQMGARYVFETMDTADGTVVSNVYGGGKGGFSGKGAVGFYGSGMQKGGGHRGSSFFPGMQKGGGGGDGGFFGPGMQKG